MKPFINNWFFLLWSNWLVRLTQTWHIVLWSNLGRKCLLNHFANLKIVAILNPTLLRHTLNMQCSSQSILRSWDFPKEKKESTKRIDVFRTRQESCRLKNFPLFTQCLLKVQFHKNLYNQSNSFSLFPLCPPFTTL